MNPQEHNMAVLGQIVKHIPKKLIEKLKNRYKIQTRTFSATSHVVAMLYAQLSHALSLNDICDCLRFHSGYLSQIRDCVPPSRNGLAHANSTSYGAKFRQQNDGAEFRQQNDGAEYRQRLNCEMDKQATSDKTFLWVVISILGVLVFLGAILIVNLMITVTTLENSINNLKGDITRLQIDNATVVRVVNHRLGIR